MKKLLTVLVVGACFLTVRTQVKAYSPTPDIIAMASGLKVQLNQITSGDFKAKRDLYAQIKALQTQFSFDERLNYILQELGNTMYLPILTEKAKVKSVSRGFKQEFLSGYYTGVQEITGVDSCTGRYNTLDSISFANNFPTALTIATRYRETHCGYYLPSNGDGPFQILSKDYGTGQINENIFFQAVQDFIDFSKAKRAQYQSKLGINLTYTGWDFTGIVNHAALYNGGVISGSIVNPNNPKYIYDGYGEAFSGAIRYGLFPKFLKVLDWELKNSY